MSREAFNHIAYKVEKFPISLIVSSPPFFFFSRSQFFYFIWLHMLVNSGRVNTWITNRYKIEQDLKIKFEFENKSLKKIVW